MKKFAILLLLVLTVLLAACGEGAAQQVVPFVPEKDSGVLYFYGVAKENGDYYVQVQTRSDAADGYQWILLADQIDASFQQEGWVGAWSPVQYDTPKALCRAYEKGDITKGTAFDYTMENGKMTRLAEQNYYAHNDVTGG